MRLSCALALGLTACAPATSDDSGAIDSGTGDSVADSATDTAPDTGQDTSDSGQDTGAPGILSLSDATNYRYTDVLTVAIQSTHEGEDTKVDLTGLTADLLGHPLDPTEGVSILGLAILPHLDAAAATEKLAAGTLVQEDIGTVYTFNTRGATTTRLSEMRDISSNFDPATDLWSTTGTFMLVAQPVGRPGAVSLTFIEPRTDVPVTDIVLTPDTARLDFDATLAPPMKVPAAGPWGADWSTLTMGGNGSPIAYTPVGALWIGRFDSLDAAQIPAHFIDLESEADALWSTAVSGADAVDDLTLATAADGSTFPGFSAGPTWAIALRCASCFSAAPAYFALVEVSP